MDTIKYECMCRYTDVAHAAVQALRLAVGHAGAVAAAPALRALVLVRDGRRLRAAPGYNNNK